MTQNENHDSEKEYLESLSADLIAREEVVAQREKELCQREAALLNTPVAAPPSGLSETQLDLSTADSDARQGRAFAATPAQRKAYGKWLRDNHPGRAPLKTFHVTLKKRNTDDRSFTIEAVDETDARRQAYQQAGITLRTEGFNAIVTRV